MFNLSFIEKWKNRKHHRNRSLALQLALDEQMSERCKHANGIFEGEEECLARETTVGAEPDAGSWPGSGWIPDDALISSLGILFFSGWEKGEGPVVNHPSVFTLCNTTREIHDYIPL